MKWSYIRVDIFLLWRFGCFEETETIYPRMLEIPRINNTFEHSASIIFSAKFQRNFAVF